jgi:hypothetical protein
LTLLNAATVFNADFEKLGNKIPFSFIELIIKQSEVYTGVCGDGFEFEELLYLFEFEFKNGDEL